MLFPTAQFAVFLLASLTLFHFVLRSTKEPSAVPWFLSASGFVFYLSLGSIPLYVLTYVITVCMVASYKIDFASDRGKALKSIFVSTPLLFAPLLYYKYGRFIADNLSVFESPFQDALSLFASSPLPAPPGISFFTFAAFAVMCRRFVLERNNEPFEIVPFEDRLSFLLFFPSILSGPLWRLDEFRKDLHSRDDIPYALAGGEFVIGLFLKLVLAGWAETLANPVFENPTLFSMSALIGGALAYSFQIYADFAGYTLMAIGVARLYGFSLPDNFNAPYLSNNLQDFWRRWHATLGRWFRDHLFLPMGGSRVPVLWAAFNAFFVMLVSGIWHGSGWNFIIWGAAHGIVLAFLLWNKLSSDSNAFSKRFMEWGSAAHEKAISCFITFVFVTMAWIPFRTNSVGQFLDFMKGLVTFASGADWDSNAWLALSIIGFFVLLEHLYGRALRDWFASLDKNKSIKIAFFGVCLIYVLSVEFSPPGLPNFIYFQF